MNDTDRMNAIESGFIGHALVHDDHGRFAVATDGWQNLQDNDGNWITNQPIDIETMFIIKAGQWFDTARQAIDAWIDSSDTPQED